MIPINQKYKILSIIVPVYNELDTLLDIIKKIQEVEISLEKEIIIIDDFSTDGTRKIIENDLNDENIIKVYHSKNMGKGAALRSGFKKAKGDIVLIQDSDLEYHPNEYPKLIEPILDGEADVVYGSRFKGGNAHRVLYFWHMLGNKFLTLLSNMFTNLNLTDMETCYKVFDKEIIKKISLCENRFGIEPEITAKISKLDCSIYEIGISYYGRTYKEGKKIGWRDAISALRSIIKYNIFS